MIRSLDTPSAFGQAEVLVVTLKKASAPILAGLLQNMLKPTIQGEWSPEVKELQEQVRRLRIPGPDGREVLLDLSRPIRIVADPATSGGVGGNRLIITSCVEETGAHLRNYDRRKRVEFFRASELD